MLAALGADAAVDLGKDLAVVAALAFLVAGVDVDDGGAGVVAVIGGGDDLVGLFGQVGVLGLALEVAGLGDGEDDLSLFVSHDSYSFLS